MTTKERLDTDLKQAMLSRNEKQTGLLRMLKSALSYATISLGHELTETEVVGILEKQAKQRRDSIEQFIAGNRQDLADKEAGELLLLENYLPAKLNLAELEKLVVESISEVTAKSAADMGKVIQAVMKKAAGAADGKTVSSMVRDKLR